MAPLIPILGLLAAGGLVYKIATKPRFVGDLAKPGPPTDARTDRVEVMVPDLMRSNASVSQGIGVGQIPPGTMSVWVAVAGADKDVLQGPIVQMGAIPLPAAVGSVVVNRRDVKAVQRNGKIARGPEGKFAGEKYRRFAG